MKARDLINKILWDKNEDKEEYEVGIIDRFTKEIGFIPARNIQSMEGRFLLVRNEHGITEIPAHRLRKVKKKGKIVWAR